MPTSAPQPTSSSPGKNGGAAGSASSMLPNSAGTTSPGSRPGSGAQRQPVNSRPAQARQSATIATGTRSKPKKAAESDTSVSATPTSAAAFSRPSADMRLARRAAVFE